MVFKQIWPDQGDWNVFAAIVAAASLTHLNKFDPIKGIETRLWCLDVGVDILFKQIWPDKGDWNVLAQIVPTASLNLNKFDPIKGIETVLAATVAAAPLIYLNKFDPIKGIETVTSISKRSAASSTI